MDIEGKELWITVYEDLTYDVVYEDPNKKAEDITVYAKVPADWAAPNCWAWSAPDGTNAYAGWPGEPLTQDGDWYAVTAPGWINSVIINANEGSIQTADISVEAGKNVWLVVSDAPGEDGKYTATVTYEEPTGTPPATTPTEPQETEPEQTTPAPTEPDKKEENKDNSLGWIIGGIAVVVLVAAVVVVVIVKKKKK